MYKNKNTHLQYPIFKGNLALSRALGDFVFKKNETKRPEEQIVTGMYTDTCQNNCGTMN